MKVLLFGEFSGLHTNLKSGLQKLGHDVTVVSFGDDFKDLDGDIRINPPTRGNKYWRVCLFQLQLFVLLPKLRGFDVVQLVAISHLVIPRGVLGVLFVWLLRQFNRKVFLNSCGDDVFVILNFIKQAYSPLQNEIKGGLTWRLFHFGTKRQYKNSKRIVKHLDGIIASNSTYHGAYKDHPNYRGFIPMPHVCEDVAPQNVVRGPVKIFFGIGSRRELKGVEYVLNALGQIQEKFGERVDIRIVEKIPYEEYVKLFSESNIFIDQACSYSYGMNALLGLGHSKVVLSGNEPIVNELLGDECPVQNILPDATDIFMKLSLLIENPERIAVVGAKGHAFAKRVHDHVVVAKRYISIWDH